MAELWCNPLSIGIGHQCSFAHLDACARTERCHIDGGILTTGIALAVISLSLSPVGIVTVTVSHLSSYAPAHARLDRKL